ncbi:MAG: hypothetical protein QXR87_05525 [Candidatus Hadarchaeales archaeon]
MLGCVHELTEPKIQPWSSRWARVRAAAVEAEAGVPGKIERG